MKKQILYLLSIAFLVGMTACNKESKENNNQDEMAVHSEDEARVGNEVDAALNDANAALETSASFTGRLTGQQGLMGLNCDASVEVNTTSNPMTITITYSGNCLGDRTRTGVVTLSMAQGTKWKDPGAQVTVSFTDLKITRKSDNKSITINGQQTYTNVSGGLLINLSTSNPITHTITSSGLNIKFDNGSQRTWQVAKQRVFTFSNGGIVITTTGTHTEGNITGVAEWGTNRFGGAFTSAITAPLVIRQDCDFRLTSGAVAHATPMVNATVTFGLDQSGNPTTCPGAGHYYFKAVWIGPNGGTISVIWPY